VAGGYRTLRCAVYQKVDIPLVRGQRVRMGP
jgi:hypothetical protein